MDDDDYRSTKGNHNERESLTSMRSNKKISYQKKNKYEIFHLKIVETFYIKFIKITLIH